MLFLKNEKKNPDPPQNRCGVLCENDFKTEQENPLVFRKDNHIQNRNVQENEYHLDPSDPDNVERCDHVCLKHNCVLKENVSEI